MSELWTKEWNVLIIEDDSVSRQILHSRIHTILPNADVRLCKDETCVRSLMENVDVILDCVVLDHYQVANNVKTDIKQALCRDKPIMISVSGKALGTGDEYDLIWTKPFPPLDQMRRDLGRVLKAREQRSPRSDSSSPVVQPGH